MAEDQGYLASGGFHQPVVLTLAPIFWDVCRDNAPPIQPEMLCLYTKGEVDVRVSASEADLWIVMLARSCETIQSHSHMRVQPLRQCFKG